MRRPDALPPPALWAAGLALACACASAPSEPPEAGGAAVPQTPPEAATGPQGPERTQGSAGRLLVYNAITGHVAVQSQAPAGLTGAGLEAVRAATLEAEIQEELEKQQDLSGRLDPERGSAEPAPGAAPPGADDPRVAPRAPVERELPLELFDSQRVEIPPGSWGNADALEVVRRSMDVDEDGRPEQVRYYDPASGNLLRREEDADFDGRVDAWYSYAGGELVERVLDSSGDGRSDVWESYADGSLRERRLDRDDDGVQDAFYHYRGGVLAEETHDADNDGQSDLRILYEERRRVRAEEDRDRDGRVDTWTTYQSIDGQDLPARIEHDSRGRGAPDVVETFEAQAGKAVLARREEDVDGDGRPDVVSIYENGKLVAREISNPDLTPL